MTSVNHVLIDPLTGMYDIDIDIDIDTDIDVVHISAPLWFYDSKDT